MNQIAVFKSPVDVNEWILKHSHYEIVDIKFQINSPSTVCTYMVWYKM